MSKENTIIQMYTASTGDASATIDIPDDGELLAAHMAILGALNADGEQVQCSLEFGSTNTFAVNDARSIIAHVQVGMGLLTSGAGETAAFRVFNYGAGIKVFGGERLYLHTSVTGGTLVNARALLLFNFAKFVARRR